MKLKNVLVLDDQRIMRVRKDAKITHCTTYQDAMKILWDRHWDEVWLDHDLGMESEHSGYWVAIAIEGAEVKPDVDIYYVHSMNPAGASRIMMALDRANVPARIIDIMPYLDREAMEKRGRDVYLAGGRSD